MAHKKTDTLLRNISTAKEVSPHRAYLSLFKLPSRRFKAFFSIAVIGLSLLSSSAIGSLILNQPVAAVTRTSSMNLADKTLSYVYLTALAKCTRDGKINDNNAFDGQLLISSQSIDQGLWFRNEQWNNTSADGPSVVRASYLAPGVNLDNGEVTCNTVVREATQLWGFENPKALFCSFVKERANGSSCETGNGDFGKDEFIGHHNDLMSAITRLVYGGTTPSLYMSGYGTGYPARYLIYEAAFMKGCSAKVASNPSADFRYRVTTVNDDGTDVERTYEGVKRDTTRYVYVDRDNLNDIALTCAQIADRVNTYAQDYALYRGDNQQESTANSSDDNATGANGNSVSSCAIDGIGWIVCPSVNFLAGLADGSFKILSDSLLRIDVKLVDTTSSTYTAWTVIRNVANVVFVIIFLIIIFSQLTSYGVSNYGVKKMLPRLIIAAILVNASFIICQLAVDISNILGYSIKDALGGVGNSIVEQSKSVDGVSPFASGEGFGVIAGGAIALAGATVVIYAMLSVLIPVLLAVVVALVMILFILIARQALVVILVVLAPLAFVAFLLPNTENLFKAWKKMFIAMLLLFPIIALVFGLSSVASDILALTFSGDLGNTEANNWFGQIIAAAVLVLPLFVVPTLLKKSLDSIPMLGQLANRLSSKANSRVGGALKDSYRGSIVGRGSAMRKQARENYRTRRFAERTSQGGVAGKINQALASNIVPILPADQYANKALIRTAEDVANEALMKDVSAASRSLEGQVTQDTARAIAAGGTAKSIDGKKVFKGSDTATRMAAISKIVESNDIAGMNQLWESSQTWEGQEGDKLRSHLARSLQSSSSKPAYFGAGMLENLRTNQHGKATDGTNTAQGLMTAAIAADAYAPDKIVGTDKDELAAVYHANKERALADSTYATSHGSKLQSAAAAALADPQLERAIGKNRANINHISGATGGLSATEPRKPA